MTEKVAKLIFWGGTLASGALFLALTVDTHSQFAALTHADQLDERVVAGKRAFERHNCNVCHTILGFGAYYAPDLTRSVDRVGSDGIRRLLEHPEVAFAGSWRKMPQQNLTAQEIDDVVAYLTWVGNIQNHDWPPQDSPDRWKRSSERLMAGASLSPGGALIASEGCTACHALGAEGERKGARLEWIGAKHDAAWIATYLENPEKVSPGAQMAAYDHLSEGQRRMIGEYINALAVSAHVPGGR